MKTPYLLLACTLSISVPAAETVPLKLIQTIPLTGVKGRFDHFAIDTTGDRLFVAALGNNSLEVIDLAAGKRIQSVPGMSKPTGVLYLPEAKQVAVVDREKRAVIATWAMDKFQANLPMALDEANHRLFIGCRKPIRLVVLDTDTGKSVTDLAISGDTDDLFNDAV